MIAELEEMHPYERHLCAYIALCTEEKFIQNTNRHRYKCKECAIELSATNDKIHDDLLAMKETPNGQSCQPSESTMKIIVFSNAILKKISAEDQLGNHLNSVATFINEKIDIDDLYHGIEFNHIQKDGKISNHKIEFINLLITTYLIMKSQKIGKKITDFERGELIRYRKKRAIIESGQ